ncbi:DUF2892 domain-containing protein [Haloarchaeobius salinus]|uniref:DUF2892 domain-containing protein n=1 Tax=Haloarchaeobius salinus TaxID=1198298 RepID=UPI00210CF034|nr:DUF2892 domain-containing protein [Haloarchaeobius salinus]
MELTENLDDRDGLARKLFAAGLAVFALWSLRKGKRPRGVLAGIGAVALGYSASTGSGDVKENFSESLGTEPTSETEKLRCAICEEPIVTGQARTPNENNETVHENCLEASA